MPKKKLTQKRLKELICYDPSTGVFTWRVYRGRLAKKGCKAGYINSNGYGRMKIDGREYPTAILANLYMEGYIPENQMDHKNRIRNDDRWCNLREASTQCQVRNRGLFKGSKSKICGVDWSACNKKWRVRICVDYNQEFLGVFENKTDAAIARWNAEKKYNFPNCLTDSSAYLYLKDKGII